MMRSFILLWVAFAAQENVQYKDLMESMSNLDKVHRNLAKHMSVNLDPDVNGWSPADVPEIVMPTRAEKIGFEKAAHLLVQLHKKLLPLDLHLRSVVQGKTGADASGR